MPALSSAAEDRFATASSRKRDAKSGEKQELSLRKILNSQVNDTSAFDSSPAPETQASPSLTRQQTEPLPAPCAKQL